jgi:hypothetical protein
VILDIWKTDFAGYPPDVGDTITGSAQPTLTAEAAATSDVLTGWTIAVDAGDTFFYNIDSVATITWLTILLKVQPLLDSDIPVGGF